MGTIMWDLLSSYITFVDRDLCTKWKPRAFVIWIFIDRWIFNRIGENKQLVSSVRQTSPLLYPIYHICLWVFSNLCIFFVFTSNTFVYYVMQYMMEGICISIYKIVTNTFYSTCCDCMFYNR